MNRHFKRTLRLARNKSKSKTNNISYSLPSAEISYSVRVLFVVLFIILCGFLKCSIEVPETNSTFIPRTATDKEKPDQSVEITQFPKYIEKKQQLDNRDLASEEENYADMRLYESNNLTDKRADKLIKQSVSAYLSTGHPCACPYSLMRNGEPCGKRSAYSRPGGKHPLCFASDLKALETIPHDSQTSQRQAGPRVRLGEPNKNAKKENPFSSGETDSHDDFDDDRPTDLNDPWSLK